MSKITVTTANICSNPVRKLSVVRERIHQAAARPGIVFGQEITTPGYPKAWRQIMRGTGRRTYRSGVEVPISLPAKRWTALGTERHRVHGGLEHISPARFFTVVRARRSTGEPVAFVNCHPVSKPGRSTRAGWRQARWDEYHAAVSRRVAVLHMAGYTVVVGGDLNHGDPPPFHPAQRNLINRGLDHLYVVPAEGMRVIVRRRRVIKRTRLMDHPILTAAFDLEPDPREETR